MPGRSRGLYRERLFTALAATAVGLGLAGVLLKAAAIPPPEIPLSAAPLGFDGRRALEYAREFALSFPARAAGDPGKAAAAQWLVDRFVAMGYDPQIQLFGAWIGGVYYPDLTTVWAERRGRSAEAVVVFAHYDLPPFVKEGGADDASGVGAVLELASLYAAETPRRSVVFVLFDGSEYGLAGSETFASRQPFLDPILAAVGLDFLNPGRLTGVSVECPGTTRGYTPVWLRTLARASARAEAGRAYTPNTVQEWVERSVAVAPTDAGMLLARGLPAVNLAGVPEDPARERAVYHTPDDLVSNLTAESMGKWGRTAERLVRTIDELDVVPRGRADAMVYLGLDDGRYLPGWAVRASQLLVFAPLLAVVGRGWYRRRRHLAPAFTVLLGEARRVAATAGCLAMGLLALKVQALVGLLPRYHLYPAAPKDPFLYHPAAGAAVAAVAAATAALLAVRRCTHWLDRPLGADWTERYHALTTLLAGLVLLAWLGGAGYAAVTFLAPPAYLWLFPAEPSGRAAPLRGAAGAVLVLAGTAPFAALCLAFGRIYLVGPGWWYILLAATYGLFGPGPSLAFFFAAALHWEALGASTGLWSARTPDDGRAEETTRLWRRQPPGGSRPVSGGGIRPASGK